MGAGADILVAGSAVFNANPVVQNLAAIWARCHEAREPPTLTPAG